MVSIVIFLIQLLLFSLVAMGLHRASPQIGLAPVLFLVAGIIGILNVIELNALLIILPNDVVLRPGGHTLVPVALLIILLLYVVQGTRTAQVTVFGILGVNLLVFATLTFTSLYIFFPAQDTIVMGLFTDETAFNGQFVRGMLASFVAFTMDMLVLIIVYQGTKNHMGWIPHFLVPGIALTLALWTDSIVYNLGAFLGTPGFSLSVPSDILVKTAAGLVITPLAGWYITRIAPSLPVFADNGRRHTLSILFRSHLSDSKLETLETELRISRTVYNELTQHIEEIFWLIDIEQKRFLYVSPAYERITKYSTQPLYDDINHFLEVIYDDDREYTQDDILQFLISERDVEFRIERPDKIIRWLRARSFPIKDENGHIIRYAGIAEDITGRKKLTEQNFELALARERMNILQNFIRDASHDLKTPISSMILKLSLLDRIEDETRRKEIRKELRGRALYLSDLITDMFTLSRIEGEMDSEKASIELNAIMQGVIQDTHLLADEKNLAFGTNLTGEDTTFEGNRDQIHRVASNIVGNAIRYTEAGSIEITTRVEAESVLLEVKDTGIGIPEESLERVFERFFRTRKAKDTQDGTGLGLAICKAIVDKHHGDLSVTSTEGEGSSFTLRLPRIQPAEPELLSQDTRRTLQEIRPIS